MGRITEHGTIVGAREPYWHPDAGPTESLRQLAGELGELLAGTAEAAVDCAFIAVQGTTHPGPVDVRAARVWSRFEESGRNRLRELSRGTRAARGETAAADADFDEEHSPTGPHPLAMGDSYSDTEAAADGLGEGTADE